MTTESAAPQLVINTHRTRRTAAHAAASVRPIDFHRTIPGYQATPLVPLRRVAAALRVGKVVIKDEAVRIGLPAYKVLGGSWALHQAIVRATAQAADRVVPFDELQSRARQLGRVTLCTATDGNHGRGIAAMAERLGFACVIYVPADMVADRIAAIESHGAQVRRVAQGYSAAVHAAAAAAGAEGWWLCADTASGDEPPAAAAFVGDVSAGYETLFQELVDQLGSAPDVLLVQAGVGALASSAITFFRRQGASTRIASVEPAGSNCVQASIAAGEPTQVADSFTIMAGLRSQQISTAAWPVLRDGLHAAISIPDERTRDAMRLLARDGVVAGESGAAGLAGLLDVASDARGRTELGLEPAVTVALINTEGATDPQGYAEIVGADPAPAVTAT